MEAQQTDLLVSGGNGQRDAFIADATELVLAAARDLAGDGGFARVREIVLAEGREGLCKRLLAAHRPAEASLLLGHGGADVYAVVQARVEA